MSLATEHRDRMLRDGLLSEKYYACPRCYQFKGKSYEYLDTCPVCDWCGELLEASTEDRIDNALRDAKTRKNTKPSNLSKKAQALLSTEQHTDKFLRELLPEVFD